MGAALGLLVPHIPALIRLAERAIKSPKSGETKKGLAVNMAKYLFNSIAGKLSEAPTPPSDEELGAAIEHEFQRMNISGALQETEEEVLFIVRGRVRKVPLGEFL